MNFNNKCSLIGRSLVSLSLCRGVVIVLRLKILKGGNQNPYIEEEQTTQWLKGQTTIYKTKDRVTRTPLKTGGELR
jgi:hypothetical protein